MIILKPKPYCVRLRVYDFKTQAIIKDITFADNGSWEIKGFDRNNNRIYREYWDGDRRIYEFDCYRRSIYMERPDGTAEIYSFKDDTYEELTEPLNKYCYLI